MKSIIFIIFLIFIFPQAWAVEPKSALNECEALLQDHTLGNQIFEQLKSHIELSINNLVREMSPTTRDRLIHDLEVMDQVIRQSPAQLNASLQGLRLDVWKFLLDNASPGLQDGVVSDNADPFCFILARGKIPRVVIQDLLPELKRKMLMASSLEQQLIIIKKLRYLAHSGPDLVQKSIHNDIKYLIQTSFDPKAIRAAIQVMTVSYDEKGDGLNYLAEILDGSVVNPYTYGYLSHILLAHRGPDARYPDPAVFKVWSKKILNLSVAGLFNAKEVDNYDLDHIFHFLDNLTDPKDMQKLKNLMLNSPHPAIRGYATLTVESILKRQSVPN